MAELVRLNRQPNYLNSNQHSAGANTSYAGVGGIAPVAAERVPAVSDGRAHHPGMQEYAGGNTPGAVGGPGFTGAGESTWSASAFAPGQNA